MKIYNNIYEVIKTDKKKILDTPSSTPVFGQPKTAEELINKYGTYNIQPTADTSNEFPYISHGLPKKLRRK